MKDANADTENQNTDTQKADQGSTRVIVADVGNVAPNSKTKCAVLIKNDSLIPWTVATTRTDCGCTACTLDRTKIDPGESATLSVVYNANEHAEVINKKAWLLFREESAPAVVCRITGFVQPWCHAIPTTLSFGSVSAVEGKDLPTRIVVLNIKPDCAIDWNHSPQAPEWIRVEVVKSATDKQDETEQGTVVRIKVTPVLGKHLLADELAGVIVFHSEKKSEKDVVVPVMASIEPQLSAFPPRLVLASCKFGDRLTREILLKGPMLAKDIDNAFVRTNIKVTHDLGDQLIVETEAGKEPGQIAIKCLFAMPSSPTILVGKIKVACKGQDVAEIPVTAKVER